MSIRTGEDEEGGRRRGKERVNFQGIRKEFLVIK